MFFTKSPGIGGRLRQRISDFIVEELPTASTPSDEYTIFWLEKFNWDAYQAIKAIANALHVSVKRFGIAGTKDKRAVTRQRISVWKISPEQLEKINIKDLRLYNFAKGERINLGNSEGNRFTITIRDIGLTEEETKKRLNKIFSELNEGIPNLFGPQRFGEVRKITHVVGKEILKGNLQKAVKIYLCKVFENEPEDAKKARNYLTKNWGNKESYLKALEIFPKRLRYERAMLDYLHKYPNDFAGALRRLPKRLRKMFINAFQAFVWNKTVTEQTKKLKQQKISLPGFDTKFDLKDPLHRKIIQILKKENIKLKDFKISSMPELGCSGYERDLLLFPKELKLLEISDDEFNSDKLKLIISFELPSGSYATIILKEIIKD